METLKQQHNSIYVAVRWCIRKYGNNGKVPANIMAFFQCVASISPVCSYLPYSEFNISLAESLYEDGILSNVEVLRSLMTELPILYGLLEALPEEPRLPDEFKGLVIYLCDKSRAAFSEARKIVTPPPINSDNLSRYYK